MDNYFETKSEEVIKYRFEDPARAYRCCCDILKHGTRHQKWYEVAYAQLYMGDTLFSMGKVDRAIDHMLTAEKLQKKYGFEDLLMKNYNITAIIYMTQGDDLLALDYYYYAIDLAKKHENYVLLGMLYNNIGAMLNNHGDVVSAVEYFEKGVEISRRKGNKDNDIFFDERQFYVNICGKYIKEKNYVLAKEYLDKAMENYQSRNSTVSEASVLSAYAMIYYNLDEKQKAYEACDRALHMSDVSYDEVESFYDYIDIVSVLIQMENYEEARQLLEILNAVIQKTPILRSEVLLCSTWIKYYEAIQDTDRLNTCYEEYFNIKKKMKKEQDAAIVTAIDNRRKLEDERLMNQQLNENNRELVRESEIDELTGINNRYGLRRKYEIMLENALKKDEKMCIAIFDVDYFKLYNDKYGHLQGDECLKRVAHIVKNVAGSDYYAARYGGDEFLIMGIGKEDEELSQFIRKLFEDIKEADILFADHPCADRVTISLGAVNSSVEKEYDISDFIHSADSMLYKVKEQGKNNFMISGME